MPRWILAAVLAALAVLLSAGAPASATPPAYDGVPAFGNVFVLVGENTSLSQLNAKDTPFQTRVVRPGSAWFTNFYGTTHWSLANYIAMTSGQFNDCQRDDLGPADCHQDVDNLFHQLDVAGVSWQEWMESMPEPCALESSGLSKNGNSYRVKHNPAIYYDNVEGAGGVWSAENRSAECLQDVRPAGGTGFNDMSGFNRALAAGTVARFNYIVPNQCEDAHDNCKPTGNVQRQFDNFLAREVAAIRSSPAWTPSSVIVIVYDEGQKGGPGNGDRFAGGNTPFAVISPMVHRATYTQLNDHYGFLRTMEDGFRLPAYLGGAAGADPLNQIWK